MPDDQTQISLTAPPRRRARMMLGIGAAALALAAGAYWLQGWWTHGRFIETTNNAYLQADTVVVAPKIAGYVTAVAVADNQIVTRGQVLARIDPAQYQSAYDMAGAELAQRRADLARFAADAARQEAAQAEAVAQVAVVQAASRLADTEAVRFRQLAKTGAETAERRDQADSTREQSTAQLAVSRAAVVTATRAVDSLRAQIDQGRAAVAAAEARLRGARADLDGVVLTAPVAGVVADRSVRVGQYVQAGTRLLSVVPVQSIYLLANFKETQLARMHPGQPATVTLDALPGVTLAGTVESISPGTGADFALLPPENATGNFTKIVQRVPVRIALAVDPSRRGVLRSGLSAEAAVDTRAGGDTP
jgi:membrane fusion protein (multidrug efflux system)